jgi:hypothetical protein
MNVRGGLERKTGVIGWRKDEKDGYRDDMQTRIGGLS